jgi:outer membrane protein TolC
MRRHKLGRLSATALVLALAACATYRAKPLPAEPDAAKSVAALSTDVARLRLAPLRPIEIDPAKGLTPLDVAVLAVLNSPDLKAKRAALGVSAAEVFAASLLPDPQISATLDQPIAGPDKFTAYSASPSLDVGALLQRASSERAAKFAAKQASLDVLWAEWTTAQAARALAETAMADEARAAFLGRILTALDERARKSSAAEARGDVSAETAAADEAARFDARSAQAAAEHDAAKARRDLDALLGLDPSVRLPLAPQPGPAMIDPAEAQRDLASLPSRRPDLLALRAGYASQDAKLRKAILAEFPLASIAFAYARDPTPTTTLGLAAVAAAPIFNGGRGEVKVQQATRDQLRAEYQARLDSTAAEVKDAEAELASAGAQAAALRAELPRLEAMLAPAPDALARGDIDSATYLGLVQTVVGKEADLADKELTRRMAEIQLETALFAPPPA